MRAVARSFSFIFLAFLLTTEVSMQNKPYSGPRTNTFTAEYLAQEFLYKRPTMIAGTPNSFYGVWGAYFEYIPGRRFVVQLFKIYAYVLEVPETKNTRYAQYAVTITTPCPTVMEVNSNTKGNVPGLNVPWAIVYETIKMNNGYTQSTPCNHVDADSIPTDPTTSEPGSAFITLFMNAITSFQYANITGSNDNQGGKGTLKVNRQGVKKVYPDTYVNRNLYDYNSDNNSCVVPASGPGKILANQGYAFKNWQEPAGFCRLATTTSLLSAYAPTASVSFSILSFVYPPYTKLYRLTCLVNSNIADATYRNLHQTCARLADCS